MWQQNQTIFYSRRDIPNIGFTEDDFKNVFVETECLTFQTFINMMTRQPSSLR